MNTGLSDHQFMKRLGQLAAIVIQETDSSKSALKGFVPSRPLKQHEEYVRTVLLAAAELVTVHKQLIQTALFLSNFRSTSALKKQDITRFDHILFHLENHFIRISTSFDRALILVNEVFLLGNEPRNCRSNIIMKNSHVIGTSVAEALRELDKYIQPFRRERNAIVHRQKYSDKDLRFLEMLYLVQTDEEDLVPFHWTKQETDNFVSDRKEELNRINQELSQILDKLFSSLEEEFIKRYSELELAG